MSNKKNIDRLFQERFKDFEAAPPATAWDHIEKELDGKKPVAVLPLWVKSIGVAAGIALLATLAYTGFYDAVKDLNTSQEIVNQNTQETSNDSNLNTAITNQAPKENINNNSKNTQVTVGDKLEQDNSMNNDVHSFRIKSQSTVSNTSSNSTSTDSSIKKNTGTTTISAPHNKALKSNLSPETSDSYAASSSNNTNSNSNSNLLDQESQHNYTATNATVENDVAQTKGLKKIEHKNQAQNIPAPALTDPGFLTPSTRNTDIASTIQPQDSTTTVRTPSLEDVAAQHRADEENIEPVSFKRWSASSMIAPVYSSTLGGSSIDQEFVDNNKSAGVNLSYGVNIGYNLSPRLSVRTGVHSVNMSYTTNDIIYGRPSQPSVQLLSVDSFDRNAVSNPGTISTDNLGSSFSQEFLADNTFNGFQGEISQRLGYLEVPLEVKYKLLDRKVSVNVMGGLSALFLTDNSIAVSNNTAKLELGEDDNFNSFNQSANFGIGIDYLFTDQLGITVEPMFKYQLNALRENTANFRPFNIGVYSGITYKF
ncbi:outer membrane beta-barrel protein [Nonlabens sp.]|uniref:outer membrane beta-barrel protein n=1 Tax=Nonlabens sp. TaxID=1888209 RepID=UPI003F69EAB6